MDGFLGLSFKETLDPQARKEEVWGWFMQDAGKQ